MHVHWKEAPSLSSLFACSVPFFFFILPFFFSISLIIFSTPFYLPPFLLCHNYFVSSASSLRPSFFSSLPFLASFFPSFCTPPSVSSLLPQCPDLHSCMSGVRKGMGNTVCFCKQIWISLSPRVFYLIYLSTITVVSVVLLACKFVCEFGFQVQNVHKVPPGP